MPDRSIDLDNHYNRYNESPLLSLSRDIGALSADMRSVMVAIDRHAQEDRESHARIDARLDRVADLIDAKHTELDNRVDEIAASAAEKKGAQSASRHVTTIIWGLVTAAAGAAFGWLHFFGGGPPPPPIPGPF
jgi:hypothetical protein